MKCPFNTRSRIVYTKKAATTPRAAMKGVALLEMTRGSAAPLVDAAAAEPEAEAALETEAGVDPDAGAAEPETAAFSDVPEVEPEGVDAPVLVGLVDYQQRFWR